MQPHCWWRNISPSATRARPIERADFGLAAKAVSEWFPVRALAVEAVLAAGEDRDVDSLASMALAKSLGVPLITKDRELSSDQVTLLYC